MKNLGINPEDSERFVSDMMKRERRGERKRLERRDLRQKWDTVKEGDLLAAMAERLPEYKWKSEYHPRGMDGQQRVDLVGSPDSNEHLVLIELERGRGHPVCNAVKAWRYVHESAHSKPVLLIQVFSPRYYFNTGNNRDMNEAVFVGKQAQQMEAGKLGYRCLGQECWPPPDDPRLDNLVERMAELIGDWTKQRR